MTDKTEIHGDITRLRNLADSLDCLTEADFMLLCQATPGTVDAWRKRGKGPNYILIGNRYLYPRKAVAKYLETCIRDRSLATCNLL